MGGSLKSCCCRKEFQTAVACVPYWFGMVGIGDHGDAQGNNLYKRNSTQFFDPIPQLVYLIFRAVAKEDGVTVNEYSTGCDRYGKAINTGTMFQWFSMYGWGPQASFVYVSSSELISTYSNPLGDSIVRTITYTLEDPYTITDAVALALTFLDDIAVISPATTYSVASVSTNFCYPSQVGSYSYASSTMFVKPDVDGNPVFKTSPSWSDTGAVANFSGLGGIDFSGAWLYSPNAENGYLYWKDDGTTLIGITSVGAYSAFVFVVKQAVKSPISYSHRADTILNTGTGVFDVGSAMSVATIDEGENLFYPGDVLGVGKSLWTH